MDIFVDFDPYPKVLRNFGKNQSNFKFGAKNEKFFFADQKHYVMM